LPLKGLNWAFSVSKVELVLLEVENCLRRMVESGIVAKCGKYRISRETTRERRIVMQTLKNGLALLLIMALIFVVFMFSSGCDSVTKRENAELRKKVATLEVQVENLLTAGIADDWVEGVKVVRRASASHLVRVWVYVDGFLTPMWEDDLDHMIRTGFYIVVTHRE